MVQNVRLSRILIHLLMNFLLVIKCCNKDSNLQVVRIKKLKIITILMGINNDITYYLTYILKIILVSLLNFLG